MCARLERMQKEHPGDKHQRASRPAPTFDAYNQHQRNPVPGSHPSQTPSHPAHVAIPCVRRWVTYSLSHRSRGTSPPGQRQTPRQWEGRDGSTRGTWEPPAAQRVPSRTAGPQPRQQPPGRRQHKAGRQPASGLRGCSDKPYISGEL